jgi:chaperone BCS1
MLNALDGVGGQRGQIFILTTNHRENLDAALIRNGRVDLHVEFTDATEEQMVGLFKSFYAHAEDSLATAFAKSLQKQLGEGRTISMAALQHYFIQQRKATAEEASKQVEKIIEEMEAMGKGKKGKEGEEKGKGAESKGEEKGKEGDESAGQKKKKKKAGEEGEEGESDDQEDADAVDDAPGKSSKKGNGGKHVKNVHVHIH